MKLGRAYNSPQSNFNIAKIINSNLLYKRVKDNKTILCLLFPFIFYQYNIILVKNIPA